MKSMIFPQPHSLPHREQFVVVIATAAGTIEVPTDNLVTAWQIRDDALDEGYQARIVGLPCTLTVVWPRDDWPLEIID